MTVRAIKVLGGVGAAAVGGTVLWLRRSLKREQQELAVLRDRTAQLERVSAQATRLEIAVDELEDESILLGHGESFLPPTTHPDHELQRDLQRSALLRSVTHDLRTPLAAIRAVVSDLHGGIEYDELTRIELLQTVLDEIDRLDRVVGNLLAASRIEAGAMEPRTAALEVDELVQHRVRTLGSLLRDHRIVVDVPDAIPEVDADYGQIEQVVTNLLANAVRYTPAGSEVKVQGRVENGGRYVKVAVVDEGPGIPDDIADRVFEPFVHGIGSRSTGLGLSICRAIVESHGGVIAIEPRTTGGTSIWFTLPIAQPLETDRVKMGEA